MTRPRSITHEGSTIRYTVVRSNRRKKTLTITIDPDNGVRVLVPARTPNAEIEAVVRKRAGWIVRKLAEELPQPQLKPLETGDTLHYLGREVRLLVQFTSDETPSVSLDSGFLEVACPVRLPDEDRAGTIRLALLGWYIERAAELLGESVERWQQKVGVAPARISIGDQKSRWGSCSSKGSLRFNLRLAMVPQELIDYVAVHELCHLLEANHSASFWQHVHQVMPDFEDRRRRLKGFEPLLGL